MDPRRVVAGRRFARWWCCRAGRPSCPPLPGAAGRAAARPRVPARLAGHRRPRARENDGRSRRKLRQRPDRGRDRPLVRDEWARTADDVLWRRTKCGLAMPAAARARVAAYVADAVAPPTRARPRDRNPGVGADASAVRDARCRAARGARRAHRHRRYADHARPPHRDGLCGARAVARRGQARDPDHRPPGGLVRPHRADVAGGRGGRRERRLLHALRCAPRAGCSGALSPTTRRARRIARGSRRSASASSRRCPDARSRPTSPIARPTSPSTSARTCRRCRARRSIASSR